MWSMENRNQCYYYTKPKVNFDSQLQPLVIQVLYLHDSYSPIEGAGWPLFLTGSSLTKKMGWSASPFLFLELWQALRNFRARMGMKCRQAALGPWTAVYCPINARWVVEYGGIQYKAPGCLLRSRFHHAELHDATIAEERDGGELDGTGTKYAPIRHDRMLSRKVVENCRHLRKLCTWHITWLCYAFNSRGF